MNLPKGTSPQDFGRAYHAWMRTHEEKDFWAVDTVIESTMSEDWDDLWDIVLVLCKSSNGPTDLGVVGAGPLEDLLNGAGPQFIAAIEAEASKSESFAIALTGVWKTQIASAVWDRVVTLCRAVPRPIDGVYQY